MSSAQYSLAKCYLHGIGVNTDYSNAVYWLTKAANQGYIDAEFQLGECYRDGFGVEKNKDLALKWFESALTHNHKQASNEIKKLKSFWYNLTH